MLAIHRRLDAVAQAAPGRVALQTPTRATTFGELLDGSDALASLIVERGIPPGARIAIAAADHATVVTAMLGILKAGCAFAPLEPAERNAARLQALAPAAIVVDPAGAAHADAIVLDGARPLGRARERAGREMSPDAMCSVYFTSGSTGAPRAIAGRLAGIEHHIAWELAYLGADERVRGSVLHAVTYDAYLPDVLVPMCAGGVACAPPRGLDAARLCSWLAAESITLVHCVPSLFRTLLACPGARELRALRQVLLAGEVVRPADVALAREVLGPRVRLVNLYGPSEATLVKLHHEIVPDDAHAASVPIGVPMPGVTVHLLDDHDRPVAEGQPGQIAIQSRYGALGYLDEPDLTRARFRPAAGGETLYLTGDYGSRLPGGALTFHGRRDRQIKLCGARVNLDEVEAILCSLDGVLESVVVADGAVLRGYVMLDDRAAMPRVRAQALERLAPAMRLAWLRRVDAFPRTASGKIDRRQLEGGPP